MQPEIAPAAGLPKETEMKSLGRSVLTANALICIANLALCQGFPESPEEGRKHTEIAVALDAGEALLKRGKLDLAIAKFREARAIEETLRSKSCSAGYELAKALTLAGKPGEALKVYEKCLVWRPGADDWHVNGPVATYLYADYAILAARQGDQAKAKEIYYLLMRTFNGFGESVQEPIPFLVVFDPDPNMDVWQYTADNLVLAATMMKLATSSGGQKGELEEIRRQAPGWAFPAAFQAGLRLGQGDGELRAQAMALAKTAREREWIRTMDVKSMRRLTLGVEMRKASPVVQSRRRPGS